MTKTTQRVFTKKHRKNLSISHKGQHSSPDTEFKKGNKFSVEVEQQRRESLRGREFSQVHKTNISKGKMGHFVSVKTLAKLRQGHIDYFANHIHPMKGKKFGEEVCRNMSKAQKLL